MILLKPKTGTELFGAYRNVLAKTTSPDRIFTSHFNFESAIELGFRSAPRIPA
jgi:hypothetical protein